VTTLTNRVVPSLLARDLPATVVFYQSILGFQLTGHHPSATQPVWVEVARDGVVLQFYAEPPKGTPTVPVLSGTLYFHPVSVMSLAAELSGRVPFEWGPEVMEYGMREFAIRDPNGYLLAFTESAAPGTSLGGDEARG
jgi:catechol 2,3-dioxygenase-like lactoylglutathione lyase family enzyme